jgi:hypothetical protein
MFKRRAEWRQCLQVCLHHSSPCISVCVFSSESTKPLRLVQRSAFLLCFFLCGSHRPRSTSRGWQLRMRACRGWPWTPLKLGYTPSTRPGACLMTVSTPTLKLPHQLEVTGHCKDVTLPSRTSSPFQLSFPAYCCSRSSANLLTSSSSWWLQVVLPWWLIIP